jgi:hypothetical protein
LDARLTTLLSKKITAAKFKDVKTGSILEEFCNEGYGERNDVWPMMMMMIMMMERGLYVSNYDTCLPSCVRVCTM